MVNISRSDASAPQVLEFLAVTGLPHDEEARRIVRSHAIRDANRRKRALAGAAPQKMAEKARLKPAPQGNFTAKFRLDTKLKHVSKVDLHRNTKKEKKNVDGSLKVLAEEAKMISRKSRKPIPTLPGGGRFDPFDSLPVKIGSRELALLQYQSTSLKQNAFAFYSKERLFFYASADSAWLHATLSLIALHFDLKHSQGLSRECLFHRGEALRIVNERLRDSGRIVDDSTIGAIASLANFDTTNGLFSSATMHLRGLVSIVHHKSGFNNGLLALSGNELLQKIVAWSDLSYSTTWDLAPQFPILKSETCSSGLPDYMNWVTESFTPNQSLSSPHDLFGEMTEIFQTMRLLSIIMSEPSISYKIQHMFTRGLYICEYKLLVVLDQTDNTDDDFVLDRNSHIYGSTRLAAYLYLYLFLREVPWTATICNRLGKRLRRVLEGDGKADLLVVWRDDVFLLNWIATMGAAVLRESSDGKYFMGILRKLRIYLGLETELVFKQALMEVLWMYNPCLEKACAAIWQVISDGQSP